MPLVTHSRVTNYKIICQIFSAVTVFFASLSQAYGAGRNIQVGAGFASFEEGDDRQRPAAVVSAQFANDYASRLYVWGRNFGPVRERAFIVSGTKNFALFPTKYADVGLGICGMMEQTTIAFADSDDQDDSETRYNLGGLIGFYGVYEDLQPMWVRAGWESHLFLAGISGILLASGRKQMLSLTVGVNL